MSQTTLTLGHSPDPDDAFMFYGLARELIPTHGLRFQHILQDIQTLNERATRGELDITAISIHAYAYVSEQYALLPSGAFQFTFAYTPSASCTVFGTTNPTLPFSNWRALTGLTEAPPGLFQFTDLQATNISRRFYRVSSP